MPDARIVRVELDHAAGQVAGVHVAGAGFGRAEDHRRRAAHGLVAGALLLEVLAHHGDVVEAFLALRPGVAVAGRAVIVLLDQFDLDRAGLAKRRRQFHLGRLAAIQHVGQLDVRQVHERADTERAVELLGRRADVVDDVGLLHDGAVRHFHGTVLSFSPLPSNSRPPRRLSPLTVACAPYLRHPGAWTILPPNRERGAMTKPCRCALGWRRSGVRLGGMTSVIGGAKDCRQAGEGEAG